MLFPIFCAGFLRKISITRKSRLSLLRIDFLGL